MKLNLEDINKAFESKARLGIMSVLLVNESIDFVSLKNLLELTDGNLASHTRNPVSYTHLTLPTNSRV